MSAQRKKRLVWLDKIFGKIEQKYLVKVGMVGWLDFKEETRGVTSGVYYEQKLHLLQIGTGCPSKKAAILGILQPIIHN